MDNYEIGDMFWGKSQSYPWWPCVIMTNSSNETRRNRKKTGTQYHVQFIGPNYDACWITNNFLVRYDGTENFESYVEEQLRSSLPPQQRHIFEMKMSGQIQAMWIQACHDAERLRLLSHEERVLQLPKSVETVAINAVVAKRPSKPKRLSISKPTTKMTDGSVADVFRMEAKCIELDEFLGEESLSKEVENICRAVYIVEETESRLKNAADPATDQSEIERIVKEQWSVLDVVTKLLYFDGTDVNSSKSRVSGRKIKVPSRLRRINELETIKKAALRKRASDTSMERKRAATAAITIGDISVTIPAANGDNCTVTTTSVGDYCSPSPTRPMLPQRSELLDIGVLRSLTADSGDDTLEIVRLIAEDRLPMAMNMCHHCLAPFRPGEKYKLCQGDCHGPFHYTCAMNHKLFRLDDISKCINCMHRDNLCCICKNSKYMKKQFLTKCSKPDCPFDFHSTCLKYLTFTEAVSDKRQSDVCPNHSCLTCCREDIKHACNSLGQLVSCTKCPISYHNNMVCIPVGCRFTSGTTIICHRHFESSITSGNVLTRCFVCFAENATLRCCRCRAVFHPKCMNMPTYTDLLKDYICPTCKLEQPLFHGQIVWTEIADDSCWTPAEIVLHSHIPSSVAVSSSSNNNNNNSRPLMVRLIDGGHYRRADHCELITFTVGESVLKGLMTRDRAVLEAARSMHVVYLNWRRRMRPFQSEKFPIIDQLSDLVAMSVVAVHRPAVPLAEYRLITRNEVADRVQLSLKSCSTGVCFCGARNDPCAGEYCHNYTTKIECREANCHSTACTNRKFAAGFVEKSLIVLTDVDVISGTGVKVMAHLKKGTLVGEVTGRIVSPATLLPTPGGPLSVSAFQQNERATFLLSDDLLLDCSQAGNEWRHLNHSCSPNAELVCWHVEDESRLGVFLLRALSPSEEVTVDYRLSMPIPPDGFRCRCKSANCAVSIGSSSKSSEIAPSVHHHLCCIDNGVIHVDDAPMSLAVSSAPPPTKPPQLHQSAAPVAAHAPSATPPVTTKPSLASSSPPPPHLVCHRCGGHGELITCNKAGCPRRYHLQCVDLATAPCGLWLCPRHFCMRCGRAATAFCRDCSTAHCTTHSLWQRRHKCWKVMSDVGEDDGGDAVVAVIALDDSAGEEEDDDEVVVLVVAVKDEETTRRPAMKISHLQPQARPLPPVVINKRDLYSACDLEPIATGVTVTKEDDVNSNDSWPTGQVNLSVVKRRHHCPLVTVTDVAAISAGQPADKRSRFGRGGACSISNYQSTDEEVDNEAAEPVATVTTGSGPGEEEEEEEDVRCQVVPMGIEDMENLIVSPMVLDD